jgi:hypothetical protein
MRHQKFIWESYEEKVPFTTLLTNGLAFKFNMFDIRHIRREMETLLDNLSKLSYGIEINKTSLVWKRGTKQHVKIPDFELCKVCNVNLARNYACNENCDGKEECQNKKIQQKQWKDVKKRDSRNKKRGFSLFVKEECRKDDFIIKYTGTITKSPGGIYSMEINLP